MNIKKLVACLLALVLVLCALPLVFANEEPVPGEDPSDIELPITGLPAEEVLVGDVTGNGEVNNSDLTTLLKYLRNSATEIDFDAADVTGNSYVNNSDLTGLLKILRGVV